MFRIGEVSKLLGVDRSFLHYYDEIGIIVPTKNEKNYRLYNENDLIAIASSKYYRSMNMPLKSLSQIILESDLHRKIKIMEEQHRWLLQEAQRMKDLAVVAEYAIETYHIAYQEEIVPASLSNAFDFVALIENGIYDENRLEHPAIQKLLNFFPFVSYAYYFPPQTLTHSTAFRYLLGLSAIQQFRLNYNQPLPPDSISRPDQPCILMPLTKNIEEDSFCYADFQKARDFADENGIALTGEAIAYCVFTNYEHENAKIKFVVQIITK